MDSRHERKIITGLLGAGSALEAMSHLHRLSSLIASDHLDEALHTAVDLPVRCLGLSSSALLMQSHNEGRLDLVSGLSLSPDLQSEIVSFGGDNLVGWVLRHSAPKAIDDLTTQMPDASSTYLRHGIRSAVCVPIETGTPQRAALISLSTSPRAFTVWEVELMSTLANHLSAILRRRDAADIGFEHARLIEQSKVQMKQLRSLYRVARTLTSTLELENVVPEVMQYLRTHLSSDVCALLMYDQVYDEVQLAGSHSSLGGNEAQYMELTRPAIKIALRSKRPVEFPDLLSSPMYSGVEAVRSLGLRSGVVAALAVKGTVIGFLAAFRRHRHGFPRHAVRVLPGLGELAAIAIENARLYRRQSDIALMNQRALAPANLCEIPGFDIGYKYAPAYQVGGDYCDIIELRDGGFGITVADVAGKDIRAASHIGMCRHSLRALVQEIRSPDNLMVRMNRLVCEQTEPEAFISMIYAVLDPIARRLSLSSAGHEPALLYRARSGRFEELSTNGLLLGIEPTETYSRRRASILMGDVLALYTDGLVDALSSETLPGVERLKNLVIDTRNQPAQQMVDAIYDRVLSQSGRSPDDVALILLKAL